MMKIFLKFCLVITGLCAMATSSYAQDRNLSEAEVKKLFDDLIVTQVSIIDTDDVKLKEKQRRQIANEVLYHYTEDVRMKYQHQVMNEKNQVVPLEKGYDNYLTYKAQLIQETKARNASGEFEIKNIEMMGQRAIADVNYIYRYQIIADKYSDIIKYSADIITKGECKTHIKVDYDDIPRISYENCRVRSLVSNIKVDKPDFIEDAETQAALLINQSVTNMR